MEKMFGQVFWVGGAGCVLWVGYSQVQPVTLLVESIGASLLAMTAIGLVVWSVLRARRSSLSARRLRPVHGLVAGAVLIGVVVAWQYLKGQEKWGAAEVYAQAQCATFVNREFNGGSRNNPAWARDVWEKNGHVVVEVLWKPTSGDRSLNSRLCVYNPETRRMQSPGAFGRERWEQY